MVLKISIERNCGGEDYLKSHSYSIISAIEGAKISIAQDILTSSKYGIKKFFCLKYLSRREQFLHDCSKV